MHLSAVSQKRHHPSALICGRPAKDRGIVAKDELAEIRLDCGCGIAVMPPSLEHTSKGVGGRRCGGQGIGGTERLAALSEPQASQLAKHAQRRRDHRSTGFEHCGEAPNALAEVASVGPGADEPAGRWPAKSSSVT